MDEDECMTGQLLRSLSKEINCQGEIRFENETATVDCGICSGASNISNRDCFIGCSKRLPPGFKGRLILRRNEDLGYTGPVIEAMSTYSDIYSILSSLEDKCTDHGRFSRLGKEISRSKILFQNDPSEFLEVSGLTKKRLKKLKAPGSLLSSFDDIIDRTSLMIRKLDRVKE